MYLNDIELEGLLAMALGGGLEVLTLHRGGEG
jgi:hypothetical protein